MSKNLYESVLTNTTGTDLIEQALVVEDKKKDYPKCDSFETFSEVVTVLLRTIALGGEEEENLKGEKREIDKKVGIAEEVRKILKIEKNDKDAYRALRTSRWWFRGIGKDYPIQAKLFRYDLNALDEKYDDVIETYEDVEDRVFQLIAYSTAHDVDELFHPLKHLAIKAQHYGMPTRLIDFTANFNVALYFAVDSWLSEKEENTDDPVIWILNPRLLNKAQLGTYSLDFFPHLALRGKCSQYGQKEETFSHWKSGKIKEALELVKDNNGGKFPFGTDGWLYRFLSRNGGFYPMISAWTNERIRVQQGTFVLQSIEPEEYKDKDNQNVACSKKFACLDGFAESVEEKFLFKIYLSHEAVEETKKVLDRQGPRSDYILFPEMEAVLKALSENDFPKEALKGCIPKI